MKYLFTTIIIAGLWVLSPIKADQIFVDKDIYKVWYDTKLEQPTKVTYEVTNRPKNADRKGMNFHKEGMFHTSDNADYYKNIWDKGHMAPAAHFSDSQENLYETFSYLNSALQHEKLNRGAWRFLEAAVRRWAILEDLFVENIIWFSNAEVLPTGATVPTAFSKNITWKSGMKKCYFFENDAPDMKWQEYEVQCD